MTKEILLPEPIRGKVGAFPESSFGAHRVALVLRDGRIIEDVVVAWEAKIVSAGGVSELPFEAADIVDVLDRSGTT